MPSPQAQALTRQHQRDLALIATAMARAVRQLLQRFQPEDVDAWWQADGPQLLTQVLAGWLAARGLTARYLRHHAALEGHAVRPVLAEWQAERARVALLVTGPVAFKEHVAATGSPAGAQRAMRARLTGAAQRLALAGSRDTIIRTARESDRIVGWRRVPDADPCAFCALLASRGAVYSKATVGFPAHDACGCTAEPLYEREPEPPEVVALQRAWREVTAGTGGERAIRTWRQWWEQQRQQQEEAS